MAEGHAQHSSRVPQTRLRFRESGGLYRPPLRLLSLRQAQGKQGKRGGRTHSPRRAPRNRVRDDSCYPKEAVSDCAFCAFFSRFAATSPALGIEAAVLPSEGAVLWVFFELWVSGEMKLGRNQRLPRHRRQRSGCGLEEKISMASQEKVRYSVFNRGRDIIR